MTGLTLASRCSEIVNRNPEKPEIALCLSPPLSPLALPQPNPTAFAHSRAPALFSPASGFHRKAL